MSDGDRTEAVTTLLRRKGLLDRLGEEPAHVRDLIDETGSSRATVHRALGELEDLGCVERGEDGMTITLRGRILRDQLAAVLVGLSHLEAAAPIVEPLPADAAVDPMLLTEAEWIDAAVEGRHRVLDRLHADLIDASSCRAVLTNLADSRTVSVLYEHVSTGGSPAELVVAESVFETLGADSPAA